MAHQIEVIPEGHEKRTCGKKLHVYDGNMHKRCPFCRISYVIGQQELLNTDQVNRKALAILAREIEHLLSKSLASPLEEQDQRALVNYLKALREIRKEELEEIKALTPEQLEALSKKD